ncbi:DUF6777 domain-containing protein [Streptomyces sp. P17]|uniref:DUF6777 domain-containing protein n=1 Tax=Streptomyces sp. P17 TaxID=3074716 RepID=UPI0028F3E28E|nr:DUF6777 domain-containing protein [Streptomyces sp. P17]MDT9699069.1 DUF6777-containing protein [Streptomyces sp. P17]
MSAEPPSSGRPTGPPSGPLSGPTQPPSGPPSQPPGGSGGGGQPPDTGGGGVPPRPEPHHPWWRSVPRVATLATVVVAAVVLALVFSRGDGGGSGSNGEVFLQAAGKTGPDPFTESTATDSSAPPVTPSPATETATGNAVRGVDGAAPGLYGGTRNVASCDVEKQIKALQADPAKNRAFASVAGVDPSGVPAYLRGLTPVQLRMDTRVTNHGYRDGNATSYQAVLQTGTAVLVDDRGVPRVRCACGNPLTEPVAQRTAPRTTGDSWPSYKSSNVVVVAPATVVINVFVVYDPERGDWFERRPGDTGGKDQKTDPPAHQPSPSVTKPPTTSPSPGTTTPCPATPTGTETTCPPSSKTPSGQIVPPTSDTPTSEPTTEPESPATSTPEVPLASDTTATANQSLSTGLSPLSPAM